MGDIKHFDAFEYYYDLGPTRTLSATSEYVGKSLRTIERWSSAEGWPDEVKKRDIEVLKELRRKSIKNHTKKSSEYQTVIKAGIARFIDNLKNGKIEVDSISDFEKLIKLDAYLDEYAENSLKILAEEDTASSTLSELSKPKLKEIVFDITGGPDREKDEAGIPAYDEGHIYLNRLIPTIYNEYVYEILFKEDSEFSEFVVKGGRHSQKSTVNGILYALTLYMGLGDATASRKTYGKLRDSCFSTIIDAMEKMGIRDDFIFGTAPNSPLLIRTKHNEFVGYFFGLDDEQKIRSFKPKNGTHFNWIEELQTLNRFEDLSGLIATMQRGAYHPKFSYSTNPRPEKTFWTNVELVKPTAQKYIIHTTYLDTPEWWMTKELRARIEEYKTVYPDLYRNEYLGEVCGGKGLVFRRIKEFVADKTKYKTLLRGLDFGLAKNGDPSAYVVVSIDAAKKELYILDEWYKQDTDYPEIARAILDENTNNFTVLCDNADAGGIKQLRIEGVQRALQCKKTRVDTGIRFLQGLTIYIDPIATPNIFREFTEYSYVETKQGDSVLPDKNNHCIDAVRYALSSYIEGFKK